MSATRRHSGDSRLRGFNGQTDLPSHSCFTPETTLDDSRSAHLALCLQPPSRPLLGVQSFCLTFRTLEGAEPTPGGASLSVEVPRVTSQRAIPFPPGREVRVLAPNSEFPTCNKCASAACLFGFLYPRPVSTSLHLSLGVMRQVQYL